MSFGPLRILIVDDEAPARARLRDLLGDIAHERPTELIGVAANGLEALRMLEMTPADVVLADIRMPVMDGIEFARHLSRLDDRPRVIFTTAYDEYAVEAFELAAVDYLVKPVRAERLADALDRVRRSGLPVADSLAGLPGAMRRNFSVNERGRILLVPVPDVIYLRAEMKYTTATTATRDYLLDESLVQIEQEFGPRFLRIHRNCLVAKDAIAGVERAGEPDADPRWDILLKDRAERLPVSRRQWATVKQALGLKGAPD